jgi:site-specific DNA recombinase
MIGAIYARTSKEMDDAFSVSSQVDNCLEYAQYNHIEIPPGFIFREDISGRLSNRPEYSKVQELIRNHRIDSLILHSTDRLARRSSIGLSFLEEMLSNKISLHIKAWGGAVKNTPSDKLRFSMECSFAEFEKDQIRERTLRGKLKKASMGKIVSHGRPPFGYSFNKQRDNFDPNEFVPIVEEVLTSYSQGISPSRIADDLHSRGFDTPGTLKAKRLEYLAELKLEQGKIDESQYASLLKNAEKFRSLGRWTNQTVYNILKNASAYAGDYEFDLQTPEGEEKHFHVKIPAIISQEVAQAVQKNLEIGRRRNERKPTNTNHLMARRLTCGVCGYSYTVAPKKRKFLGYYKCSHKRNRHVEIECNNKPIQITRLDKIAKDFIRELLLNPDNLFSWWEEQHQHNETENQKTKEEIARFDEKINELQGKLNRTLYRLTDNLDSDEIAFYSSEKDRIKKLLAEYREDKEQKENSLLVTTIDPETIQSFAEMGEEYKEVLETSEDFSFWRGLVEDLDLTGIINLDEKGQYIEFVLMGNTRQKEYINNVDTESSGKTASM